MANRFYSNGDNTLTMNLSDNAVWNVTGDCLLSSLTIGENATLQGENGTLVMTVDGTETEIAPGTYEGEIRLTYTENAPAEADSAVESSIVEEAAPSEAPAVSEAPAETADSSDASSDASTQEAAENTASTGVMVGILAAVIVVIAIVAAVVVKKKRK